MVKSPPQVCILGGGFAGIYTALRLSRFPWFKLEKPQIILVDQEERFLFTPFLYELVTEELQTWEVAPRFVKLLANTNIQFCRGKVKRVDLKTHQVQLEEGLVIAYDYLILAVGRETILDSVPGAATYSYPFRTLSDADRLKEKLRVLEVSDRQRIRIAIVGGGPSGVELACKLADRLQNRVQVRLITRGEQILKTFTAFSRESAQRALQARNIWVDLETRISAVGSDQITLVCKGQVDIISTDLVVWTIGTQASQWIRTLHCQHNSQGQLLSLSTLQLTDHPKVFALGDVADIRDARGKRVPATAQAAYQQADCAAWNLWASLTSRPLRPFRYWHLGEMLALGTKAATVSSLGIINLKGNLAYVTRRLVYLLLRMPTLRHRLQVARHWLASLFFRGWLSCWQR